MKYMKLGSKPDSFQSDGNNIRYVASELATDITVNVVEVKFYLHKFPLLSKSARLQKLLASINEESSDEIDIPDIPGGSSAFEICAKFCYGMTVTLNAYNVVAARCAAEYLEMNETIDKGNLISKIEVFLNSSIFRSWKDSILVLQTTESLLPWSEELKIINHCIDSIASKASINPSEVEWSYTYNRKKLPSENGLDSQCNGVRKQLSVPKDWWVEDLCELEMDSYKRVIMAIKTGGRSFTRVIGEALKAYAYRRIPGFSKGIINPGDVMRSRVLVETIVWLLPTEKGSVSCSFMLKLLKFARLVDCAENCKNDLVKKVGRQLQEASALDLLIPSSEGNDMIYDVDIVLNIVEEFMTQENGNSETSSGAAPEELQKAKSSGAAPEELQKANSTVFVPHSSKIAVASLIDGYLVEVSKGPNLPLSKFIELAEMASSSSRPVHDGLYWAIDMYLKEHPGLTKTEKKKICSLMDCKKLTPDASTHAIQNDLLPLRLTVQILFYEQVRASASSASASAEPDHHGASYTSSRSAAPTNTEDDWAGDINSLKSMNLGCSERPSGSGDVNVKAGNGKVKGLMPKKLLSKLWSSKGGQSGENSSSDTSESPMGSVNPEETKSTPSRNVRHSVS